MLPGHATQPWEVLEIGLIHAGITTLASNDYLLLAVDKTFQFPFAFPRPMKQAEGVTRELLQLCVTSC